MQKEKTTLYCCTLVHMSDSTFLETEFTNTFLQHIVERLALHEIIYVINVIHIRVDKHMK